MRFPLLMLAAYLGAVACQKDQSHSHGTSGATGDVAASASSQSAAVTTAGSTTQGSAPTHVEAPRPGGAQLRGQRDQPVDDEAMSATDKSGVDNPETDDDDSQGADDAEEE